MKKRVLSILISLCLATSLLPVTALANETEPIVSTDVETSPGTAGSAGSLVESLLPDGQPQEPSVLTGDQATVITTQEQLTSLLNDTGSMTGTFQLGADIIIDTNTLRPVPTAGGESSYIFKGNLDGNGHTITVSAESVPVDGFAPLFDTVQGSISNLNVVFKGDVKGTTIAYDIGYGNDADVIELSGISVTVDGDILYGAHDFTQYYASIMNGSGNYGNWYNHFGGQPVYLATGFAWYTWGASLTDITINVKGNIGTTARMDNDTTSTGFAYFAANGGNTNKTVFQRLKVCVEGDIQSYTGKGHASAYGFANGTADSSAGFGCNTIEEMADCSVTAQNIIADSQQGASSAMGFARFLQGYTHGCSVTVPGKIYASNQEGAANTDQYSYMNGDAYAYGFMLNTGGWSIDGRRSFIGNSVNVGDIEARTQSETYEGTAFASGFAHQMMNTASSVPDLTYNNNSVNVTNSISANANKGSSIAAGFVTSSGRDYFDRPDHIYANTVTVGGDISAKSLGADAAAAGYAYYSKTHFRDCIVHISGNIVTESPTESVSAGFVVFQYQNDNYYFVKNCSVEVDGNIEACRNGSQNGAGVAGGLIGVLFDSTSSVTVPTAITGNTVSVDGMIFADNAENFSGIAGLIIGLNAQTDPAKSAITLKDNQFIGKESLLPGSEGDTLYTNFVGQTLAAAMEQSDNSVIFTKPDGRKYSATVEPVPDTENPQYITKWKLTDITDIVQNYTITPSAGANGSISPNQVVTVQEGGSQTFTITPNPGYHIADVKVDGASVGAVPTYTFTNVVADRTITATFAKDSDPVDPNPEPTEHTLRFETNGGETIKPITEKKTWTMAFVDLPTPERDGYTFEGWYRNSTLTMPVTGDVRVYGTVTLFAKWSEGNEQPGDSGVSMWLNTKDHFAYMKGYPDGTFAPGKGMTRAEVAQVFFNLLLDQDMATDATFTDVPADAWYSDAVHTLTSLGILTGYEDGTFKPDQNITRAEFCTIVMRFADDPGVTGAVFTDVRTNDWFYEAVTDASAYGFINGYPDGSFKPGQSITRAEVTTIVNRMLSRSADTDYVDAHPDRLVTFSDVGTDYWAYYHIAEATNSHNATIKNGVEIWK